MNRRIALGSSMFHLRADALNKEAANASKLVPAAKLQINPFLRGELLSAEKFRCGPGTCISFQFGSERKTKIPKAVPAIQATTDVGVNLGQIESSRGHLAPNLSSCSFLYPYVYPRGCPGHHWSLVPQQTGLGRDAS